MFQDTFNYVNTTPVLLSIFAIVFYLASSAHLIQRFLARREPAALFMPGLSLLAVVCHALGLYPQLFNGHGLWLSFFTAASLIALFIVLLVLVCMKHLAAHLLLAPFQLLATITIAGSYLIAGDQTQVINETPGVLAHILLSIIGYGVISIAMLQSIILLFQEQQLRKRPVSALIRSFPPLQSMESLLFSLLWGGWLLLTLSLITGWLFLDNLFAQHLVHKTFFACLAWSIFSILLWGRHQLGWRGHKAIRLTLVGFFLLMLAYFGSKLVREFILFG